jgi:hypothetical protein
MAGKEGGKTLAAYSILRVEDVERGDTIVKRAVGRGDG